MKIDAVTIKATWIALAEALADDADRGRFFMAILRYAVFAEDPPLDWQTKGYYFFKMIQSEIDKSAARRLAQEIGVQRRKERRAKLFELQTDLQTHLQKPLQNALQTCLQKSSGNAVNADKTPEEKSVSPQTDLQTHLQKQLQNDLQKPLQNQEKEKEKKTPPVSPRKENSKETLTASAPAGTRMTSAPTFFSWIPESLKTPEFIEKWQEWEKYRSSKRRPISSYAASRQLAALERAGVTAAIAAIDEAIRNDYQGLFPKSTTTKPQKERDYSGC